MKTLNYLIRNIPPDLWTRAKHRAVDEGISLRELIFKAIEEYLK
jgi:predicted HicB family RNase H-like nuclease